MKKSGILTLITAIALIALAISLLVLPASAAIPNATDGQEIDVYLIAGQSNATGYGTDTDNKVSALDSRFVDGFSNVYYYGSGDSNKFTEFTNVKLGMGQNKDRSGAEIGIAAGVDANGRKSAVIKYSYGSAYVYPDTTNSRSIKNGTWTPPSYIEKHGVNISGNKIGNLYWEFLDTVGSGLDILREAGYTPVIKGLLYVQGEAETFSATCSGAYEELLTTFISDIRRDLGKLCGDSLAEMPFVISRLARNPKVAHSSSSNLQRVQTAQDAVAANTALTNVFIVNPATDLPQAPAYISNTDGWHYDAFTQKMIGEAAVAKMLSVQGESTKYGMIPQSAIDANDYPFAIFTESECGYGYEFDSLQSTWKTAYQYVAGLTPKADTKKAVIFLRCDYDVTVNGSSTGYPDKIGNCAYDVTVDLGGHTLVTRCTFNPQFSSTASELNFTIKNGTLLSYQYALIYSQTNSTGSNEITCNFTLEDLTLGFAQDHSCSYLLTYCTEGNRKGSAKTNFNFYINNCTVDLTNQKLSNGSYSNSGLALGSVAKTGDKSALDDVKIYFKDSTVKANAMSQIALGNALDGDKIYFLKGANGDYGKILLKSGSNTKFVGFDYGKEYELTATNSSVTTGDFTVFDLIPTSKSVNTVYGEITQSYADADTYPFAVFVKVSASSEYSFKKGYTTYKAAMNDARTYAKAGENTPAEVVVLQRRDYVESSYPTDTSIASAKIILDLGGFELTVPTLMNVGIKAESASYSEILVKNGRLLNSNYGLFYTQVYNTYLGNCTMEITFENLYIGYHESCSTARTNLIINTQNRNKGENNFLNVNYIVNVVDCTVDLITNTTEGAKLGASSMNTQTYAKLDDFTFTVSGGEIITTTPAQIDFNYKDDGDILLMDSAKLPKIVMSAATEEPDISVAFQTNTGDTVALVDISGRVGGFREYGLIEIVTTQYGIFPAYISIPKRIHTSCSEETVVHTSLFPLIP